MNEVDLMYLGKKAQVTISPDFLAEPLFFGARHHKVRLREDHAKKLIELNPKMFKLLETHVPAPIEPEPPVKDLKEMSRGELAKHGTDKFGVTLNPAWPPAALIGVIERLEDGQDLESKFPEPEADPRLFEEEGLEGTDDEVEAAEVPEAEEVVAEPEEPKRLSPMEVRAEKDKLEVYALEKFQVNLDKSKSLDKLKAEVRELEKQD